MTFSYQFEQADWIAFITHHLKNSRVHRRQRLFARVGVLCGVLAVALIAFLWKEEDLGFAATFLVTGVVVFFAYPKVYDDSIMKRIKKMVGDPDNAKVFGRQTVTLSPEGIHTTRPGAQATIAWGNIVKVEETGDHLFLYVSAEGAIIIPRLSLEGASLEDVKKQLQQYVGKTPSRH